MEQKFNEILQKAKMVQLKADEKAAMRARLYAAARGESVVNIGGPVRSFGWRIFRPAPIFAGLMITLLAGGGVSFASEQALPGDVLYGVKVNINEEIRSVISLSDVAKETWEVRRVERRLEEAERLSDAGNLDSNRRAIVELKLEKIAEGITRRSETIQDKKVAALEQKTQSKLDAVLQKHGRILASLTEDDDTSTAAGLTMASSLIAQKTTPPEDSRNEVRELSDRGMEAAQNKILEARKKLENKDTEINKRLESAEAALEKGRVKTQTGEYGEAVLLLRRASKIAKEVIDSKEVSRDINKAPEMKATR